MTVYKVMTKYRITNWYYFDLLIPCRVIEMPTWIKRAKKQFVPEEKKLKACKVKAGTVSQGENLSTQVTADQEVGS